MRRVFAEELNRDLARHLSTWEVTAQNREMVAEYVTPPLLQKSATVLKTVIDPIREDAFAKELEKISDALVQTSIEKPQPAEASAPGIATAVAPTSVAPSPSVDARGILPWFDILARAGKLRRRQQEEQIEKIPAAAVFVGQHAVADWQVRQMYSFLEQFVERECAVIPVLLPDAPQKPKLPVFLANFELDRQTHLRPITLTPKSKFSKIFSAFLETTRITYAIGTTIYQFLKHVS